MPDDKNAQEGGQVPPWRRLFHEDKVQQEQAELAAAQQQDQEQQAQEQQQGVADEPLSELQEQMLLCYRKTFIVAGAGMVHSVWRWNTVTKHKLPEVFLPPRAQALPEQVVQRYKQKAQFREGVAVVGRQTVLVTGIAALYFGTELGVGLLRDRQGDWANTAAAGAVAGGVLGSRVPSAMRGRTIAVASVIGGLLGGLSGWTQQQLSAMVAEDQKQQQEPEQPSSLQPQGNQQQ